MLGRDSEDEIWSRFVFEFVIWTQEVTLVRWTQSSGPLCLWQCFNIKTKELRSSSELSKQTKLCPAGWQVVRLGGWESEFGIRREVQVGQGQELVQLISKDAMRLYLESDFTVSHLFNHSWYHRGNEFQRIRGQLKVGARLVFNIIGASPVVMLACI